MNNKDLKFCIGFSFIPGIGRVRLAQLKIISARWRKRGKRDYELKKARLMIPWRRR